MEIRRRCELYFFSAVFCLVRLGGNSADLVSRVKERLQDYRREVRRPHKNNAHTIPFLPAWRHSLEQHGNHGGP